MIVCDIITLLLVTQHFPSPFCSCRVDTSKLTKKREDYIEWPDYFMAIALLSAQRSKDPNTQVCLALQMFVTLDLHTNHW